MMLHRLLLAGLCAALALPLASGSALAQAFDPGDALVLDLTGGRIIGVKLEDGGGWSAGDQFVVPSGGPLDFPRGLAIASQSDGALFLSVYNEVVRVEAEDDRQDLVTVFSAGPPLLVPRGITFDDSEEDFFVALTRFDFISWIYRLDRITGIQTPVSKGLVYPRGLARDPSDPTKLLVADSQVLLDDGRGVYRVDPEAYDPSEPLDNVTLISQHGDFSFPNRLAAADGRYIYVTDPGLGGDPPKVVRVDRNEPDPQLNQTVVASGGYLLYPIGIAIESNGDLLVSDADAQAIIRIDPLTGDQTIVSPRPGSSNLFDTPWEIQIVPELFLPLHEDLLVTDTGIEPEDIDTGVFEVIPSTPPPTRLGTGLGFSRPTGAVVDHATGELVVVDAESQTVYRMNRTTGVKVAVALGGYLDVVPPEGETELLPMSVVVDADGDYLVTDPNAARVIRIDPLTGDQTILTPNGFSESFFKRPMATEIDDEGRLLVADAGDPDVAEDGRLIEVNPAFGQQWCISQGELLEEVTDIIRDEDGSFVFAGRGTTPVFRLAASGFRGESESGEYQSAGGVAIDANRDILVVDAGDPDTLGDGRVLRLDPLESEPSVETGSLYNGGVGLSDPFGIAVDAVPDEPAGYVVEDQDGDLVSDEDDNCMEIPNQGQWNNNPTVNVFGDACDADFDNRGGVGVSDFGLLSESYGTTDVDPNYIESVDRHPYGAIGIEEFGVLSAFWGKPLGPAGDRAGFDPQGPCTDPPDPTPDP